MRKFFAAIADAIDGLKCHLANVVSFGILLYVNWGHWDPALTALMGLTALSSLFRLMAWKPGPLSGTETFHQPDGGTLIVKPPPVEPS